MVSANASDNVAVAGVQFKLDGTNLGQEDVTSPYSLSWNTNTATNAQHTLTAVATDTSGNQKTSSPVTVTVSNAPLVTSCDTVNTNSFFGCYYDGINFDTLKMTRTDNEINFENLNCVTNKMQFGLTAHEAMLLKFLIENRGKVVSRKEILQKVWNISSEIETRTVDNFILRLRKYFEPDPANPIYFISIRGAGYMFDYE